MVANFWNYALYILNGSVCKHIQEIALSFEYYKCNITDQRVCNIALLNVTMISRKIQHNIWLMGEMASLIIYCWMLCNMCFLLASTLECSDPVITSSVLYFVLYMVAMNCKRTLYFGELLYNVTWICQWRYSLIEFLHFISCYSSQYGLSK